MLENLRKYVELLMLLCLHGLEVVPIKHKSLTKRKY